MNSGKQELMVLSSGEAEIPYRWAVGLVGSRFLREIRDNQRFFGLKCPKCHKVYVPPRQVCGPCFTRMDEWVELGIEGTLEAFSVVNYRFIDPETGKERPVPYTYGYIKLDGADSMLSHIIHERDAGKLRPGLRVKAVFAQERHGSLKDIQFFEVIEG